MDDLFLSDLPMPDKHYIGSRRNETISSVYHTNPPIRRWHAQILLCTWS